MTTKIDRLGVQLTHRKGKRRGETVTDVLLVIPGTTLEVARASFGGRYSEEQALGEFWRLPNRWRRGFAYETAVQMGLAPEGVPAG